MRHHALLLATAAAAAAFAVPAPCLGIDAPAARRYTTERRWVRQIDAAASAALRAELEAHIVQWLDLAAASANPKPLFLQIGITGGWIVFGNPGETAQTLSEALPHLTPATQDRVKLFLRGFVRANDPTTMAFDHCAWGWGARELTGVRREYFTVPVSPNPDPLSVNVWPAPTVPPEALYMLWRYADRTGDWDFISSATPPSGDRWNRIRTLFERIPATPSRYGEVSGAIGYARILERFNLTADATYNAAIAKVQAGLTAGAAFDAFVDASYARFLTGTHDWAFTPFHYLRQQNAVGAHLAPEIGRFLRENALAAVRARVTFNPNEGQTGQKNAIEAHWPEWYLYRGGYPPIERWVGHYGENHMVTPDTPWALFMIHAFVYEEPGATLARYLDAPYGIGDLFHIQRLAAAIEGFGTVTWSASDPGGTPPANQPPSVLLTAPANGATFTAPASITLAAAAADSDGTVTRVDFLRGSAVVASVATAPFTAVWNNVAAGSYTLTARATDNQGAETVSAPVWITVTAPLDTTPPTTPASLTATAQSSASIALAWSASTDNGAVAGYEIERNGALLPNLVAATSFTDSGLQAATLYTYRVRAVDGAGNRSAFSAAASVTTPAAPPPPAAANLLVNGNFERGDANGWYVHYGLTVEPGAAHASAFGLKMLTNGRIDQVFPTTAGRTYYVMARVRIDREVARPSWGGLRVQVTAYDWQVRAERTIGVAQSPAGQWTRIDLTFTATTAQSRFSYENFSGGGQYEASADDFLVSEQPIPPDNAPPANQPPTVALTAPAAGASFTAPAAIALAAAASDSDGTVARVDFLANGAVLASDTAAPFAATWANVPAGSYTLAARATDDKGAVAMSAAVQITVTAFVDATPPTAPSSLTAVTQSSTSASLRWTASTDNIGVAGYEIERNGVLLGAPVAATSYTDNALAAGTAYTWRVRAFDAAGNRSAFSASATATTPAAPPPPAAGNLLVNGGFETGSLTGWNAPGATVVSSVVREGGWAARITNNSIDQVINTVPGKTYKLTAWLKIESETGSDWGGLNFSVQTYDWKQIAFIGWLNAANTGTNWTKFAATFTAAGAQTRIAAGYFGGPGRRVVAYLDSLAVFEKTGNTPPTLNPAMSSTRINAPGTVTFTTGAEDPDGAIVRVDWDFGDGVQSQLESGSRAVRVAGSFRATVRVADDDGNVVSKSISWSASNSALPSISFASAPAANTVFSAPQAAFNGSIVAQSGRVTVSTDRGVVVDGTVSGSSWSATVPLKPGRNRVLASVRDGNGRVHAAERVVRYVPGPALAITGITETGPFERWEPVEINFQLENSAATHPQFPYESAPHPGLAFVDGVSVDAVFTRDGSSAVYRRPAFLRQDYQRALKSGEEWMYPQGTPVWTVRFAPPEAGLWRYRIEAREAKGSVLSAERTFAVGAPSNPWNRGPVRVSAADTRYFEYADGSAFLGGGSGIGASHETFSYDMANALAAIGTGNQQWFRWWIAGQIWGSAWAPWASRTLGHEGTVAPSGLTVESRYGDGIAALRLDEANPLMFQGFSSGHAALIPGRSYRVIVRWRTEGVAGPRVSGQPFGVCVKFTGWPEPGQTGSLPALVPHVAGDTPWHVSYGDFTAAGDLLPNLALILENATAGRAFVDEIGLYERLAGGALGPQLLRNPKFNSHLTFDPRRSAGMDVILRQAAQQGIAFRLVVSEKQEYLLNHYGPEGLPDRNGGHFNRTGATVNQRLHEYYWRYLFARFGAFRSVHSWELVNEEAPGPTEHFKLAARLAQLAGADGNPHPATTSTWATLAEDAWKAPFSAPISNVDFHLYARFGWIQPQDELAHDSARFYDEYSRAARSAGFNKPVTWGEQGIAAASSTDHQDPGLAQDTSGVWLHKMIWAGAGPGGVYPLYWYTDNIFGKRLHSLYGNYNRFMAGIPLANGRYEDAAAVAGAPSLRVMGQKDTLAGAAHLWIDNRAHTWRAVVDGAVVAPVSGTVTVEMAAPGARYAASWYETRTGQVVRSEMVTAQASGAVVLSVSGLATDTAVRLQRQP